MEPHNTGIGNGDSAQDFLDFPEFPATEGFTTAWNQNTSGANQHQQFYPPYGESSSFPYSNHHQSYASHYGHSQSSYNTNQVPYQAQPFHQTPSPTLLSPMKPQFVDDDGRDYRTPTSPYRDVSPQLQPYIEDSPMQRMQQLTRMQYGGPLAAQSAAAAAADAARNTWRSSPPGMGKAGEETVRDVLHRQYVEQRRMEEQNQQLQQQSVQLPSSFTSSLFAPIPQLQLSSPSPAPLLVHPSAPATPIFRFPTPHSPACDSAGPPTKYALVAASSLGPLDSHGDSMKNTSLLKTKTLMMSLHKANTAAAEGNASVELLTAGALHKAATVVQSLEAKERPPTPPSSSRKRSLQPVNHPVPPLKPGMRRERNEKGQMVDRLYVLVHHCNKNDPDYTPNGVLMPYDQYKKEAERDDMITFSYSSMESPYEYVDFRMKKNIPDSPAAAGTGSKVAS